MYKHLKFIIVMNEFTNSVFKKSVFKKIALFLVNMHYLIKLRCKFVFKGILYIVPFTECTDTYYHRIKDDRMESSIKGIRIWHCVFAASIILCSTPT